MRKERRSLGLLYILTILLVLGPMGNALQAQAPDRSRGEGQLPRRGEISGRVMDAVTGSPVSFASVVVLHSTKPDLNSGGITDENGDFRLGELAPGKYSLELSFMGFKKITLQDLQLSPQASALSVGTLLLEPDMETLDELVLVGEASTMVNSIDKKVVNVGKDLLAAGADAAYVLSNIPSIDVDVEGTISLRGNENVRILLDGKPTNMSSEDLLAMLPADAIEKVELITNPSAKYDPDGMSGIINIVTRKERMQGYNGTVSAGVGTGNKYNASANMNYRTGKWNFFNNYAYNNKQYEMDKSTMRYNYLDEGHEDYFVSDQFGSSDRKRSGHSWKIGADYDIDSRNVISYNAQLNWTDNGGYSQSTYDFYGPLAWTAATPDSTTYRNSNNAYNNFNQRHNLNYRHNFAGDNHYLEVDASLSLANNEGTGAYENIAGENISYIEQDHSNNNNRLAVVSMDYNREWDRHKVEFGAKYTSRHLDNPYTYWVENDGELQEDEGRSNHFSYDEQILAAYGIYAYNMEKWSFQAGLRGEQVFTKAHAVDIDSLTQNNYFALYPSLHIIHHLNDDNELMLNYSRRVTRPSVRELNPTPIYTDPYNIKSGNPYLQPEFTNSIELAYSKYWTGGSLNSAVFFRSSDNTIRRVNVNEEGVNYGTYENLASSRDWGLETSVMSKLTKWWSLNGSFNAYYTNLISDMEGIGNDGWNWSVRLNNSFRLADTWSATLSGRYQGERVITQGTLSPYYTMDLGIKKDLMDKKASISLRLSDVANSMEFYYDTTGSNFEEHGRRKWETQVLYLNFNYRFGDGKAKKRKRKSGSESLGGMDVDF